VPADTVVSHKSISAPMTLSALAEVNDLTAVATELSASSLPSIETTLMQLRFRISNRPAPLPLRSISPLSSSSSGVFLPSSLGAPAVDLQANSLSLSASTLAIPTTYDGKDISLSQLARNSLSLSANDVGTDTAVITTSLLSNNTANSSGQRYQQDCQEDVPKTALQTRSPSLRSLSAASSSDNSSRCISSDDENILVISPVCAHFACEPRATPGMHVSFGHVIKGRICSLYFTYWKAWYVSRKDRVSVLQSSMKKRLMGEALSSVKLAYAKNVCNKMLLHWAWFTLRQRYTSAYRFRTCKALHEAFLLRKSFKSFQSKALLISTLSMQASLHYRTIVMRRCLCHGLIFAYRELVGACAQAALHHCSLLRRVSLRSMCCKTRHLSACENSCVSLRATYLVTTSFYSMIKIHAAIRSLAHRRSLALTQRALDCWQYVFFRRLRVYASYDAVSSIVTKRSLLLAFTMWHEQLRISVAFRRWRKLCTARFLIRRYSGTSRFSCLSDDEAGYNCTYRGIHPRVETIFRGAFEYLRDRARLLLIKEKLVVIILKRRVFERIVLAYCKRETSINWKGQEDAATHELDKLDVKGVPESNSLCTDTPKLIFLDAHRYKVKNKQDATMESGALYAEIGVQVLPIDFHAQPCQPSLVMSRSCGGFYSMRKEDTANRRDSSTQVELSHTYVDVQKLNTVLTHSPTTVRQIINKYRRQPINEQPSPAKPVTKNVPVQSEDSDETYCVTNIVSPLVRSPQRSQSPKQLPILRQVHRVRSAQQLRTQFIIERHSTTGKRGSEAGAGSSSVEEISSVVYENQVTLEVASPRHPNDVSVYSETASPFHFAREQSTRPVTADFSEQLPPMQMPDTPSDFNKECEGILIEGPEGSLSSSAPPPVPLSPEDLTSDMFAGMQIISFSTGQLNESVIALPVERQENAVVTLSTEQRDSRLTASHPLPSTGVRSYKMLDARYHLVSSFTEAIKKHEEASRYDPTNLHL
ncbi:Hypothetical protein DHA2_150493, partial [Giardia duodenalis]